MDLTGNIPMVVSYATAVALSTAQPRMEAASATAQCGSSRSSSTESIRRLAGWPTSPVHLGKTISLNFKTWGAPLLASFERSGAFDVHSSQTVIQCAVEYRHFEDDHVWQRRFYDFHMWTERKGVEKLRYMHRNPVKDALVQEPEQWP